MEETKYFDITVDSSILASFQNTSMEMFKVFREFIDNSLQSYLDHEDKLDSLPDSPKKLVVRILWNKTEIVIEDNAWGMDEEAFSRALKLNKISERSKEDDRLSRFGMGLKTAACYASRDYIIISAAYGSQIQYRSEMDIDFIEEYAPKTNKVDVSGCPLSEHGTTIRMKKLNPRCVYNANAERKVRSVLARIYNKYISDGTIEISINGEVVVYNEPKMFVDPNTGSEALKTFSNDRGFEFEGKRYKYEGWLGVVEKGDSSGATTGFQYYQANRVIVFSDHPRELFGNSNDARYQHVVGEICLLGNEWPITINKDQLQWEDSGLRNAFINDLKQERNVLYIFQLAKKTKFRKAMASNHTPSSSSPINTPVDENNNDDQNDKRSLPAVSADYQATSYAPSSISTKITKKITYKETTYKIDIVSFDQEPDKDWITLKMPDPDQDQTHLEIEINVSAPALAEYAVSPSNQKLIYMMAEFFALARIEAEKAGLKMNDSFAVELALNEIMRKAKC